MMWFETVLSILVVTCLFAVTILTFGSIGMKNRIGRLEEDNINLKQDNINLKTYISFLERRIVYLEKSRHVLSHIVKHVNVRGRFDVTPSVQQTPALHIVK